MNSKDDLAFELGSLIGRSRVPRDGIDEYNDPAPPSVPQSINWNEGQRDAIQEIATWRADVRGPRCFKLTGPAGAGKSTVMQAVRQRLRGSRTAWAAMTGRAAARLKEASGVNGKTLHSVLYHPPREVDNVADQKIDLEFDKVKYDGRSCLLVIDEASMVGPKIFADISRSAYDKVLFVGDPYQIPPVLSKQEEAQRGADYSVFAGVAGPHLTEVMRTSGAVLRAASHVREKQSVPESDDVDEVSAYRYVRAGSQEVAMQIAIVAWLEDPAGHALITWRNDVRMHTNRVIRTKLGKTGARPEPGEVVVVRRNVYGTELMNGDHAVVEEWFGQGPTLCGLETAHVRVRGPSGQVAQLLVPSERFDGTIPYVGLYEWKSAIKNANCDDPTPITYGYCLTAHLAQGSEWRRATTFLPGDMSNPHFRKQTVLPTGENMTFGMRFLYTAISRAKEKSTLIISG